MINVLKKAKEVFWINPNYDSSKMDNLPITKKAIYDAYLRLQRFRPYIKGTFGVKDGIIESPLIKLPNMKTELEKMLNREIKGKLFLKCDNELPISGSIKARGGIYEVLHFAEKLAFEKNMLTINSDYRIINSKAFKDLYSQYKIAVGSTGNLGLSIGIISAELGFTVYVHMSQDAKEWKKDLLRNKGVNVIEYDADYSVAVTKARKLAESDPLMYFVDDENSENLFLGYAAAAYYLKEQLAKNDIIVDKDHPLYVYLPCGVGGGPGGITFGLKQLFKDNVHCIFAEPTHSPCMLLGLMTGLHDKICVQDIGLDNKTIADGLAVGRASGFVGKLLENLIYGVYTVSDEKLIKLLKLLYDSEKIKLEPSALAGFYGIDNAIDTKTSTHIIWSTGGGMVPNNIFENYYNS